MEILEDTKLVKEIIQGILKAKKNLALYPSDNPICLKIIEETFSPIKRFLSDFDVLTLIIKPQTIFYGEQCIYSKLEKEDNLALFFFKDGLRELTFKKGFDQHEFIDLINIIITDFQKDMLDDDVVTLLWEREFKHLTYVVEEIFHDSSGELERVGTASDEEEQKAYEELKRAFQDSLYTEENRIQHIIPLDEDDKNLLFSELEEAQQSLVPKLISILFEILRMSEENQADASETIDLLGKTFIYSFVSGDILSTVNIINTIKNLRKNPSHLPVEVIDLLENKITSIINGKQFIKGLTSLIDKKFSSDTQNLSLIIKNIKANSLPHFIECLSDMRSERGQKIVNDILCYLGKKDSQALAMGLRDERWFVVKSILNIINQIGDKSFVEHIKGCLTHPDVRVRKEAVRTVGNLKVIEALPILKNFLFDCEKSIRLEAIDALGKLKSSTVKSILFYEIQKKDFIDKDFIEKKKFYHFIASMPDPEVIDFFLTTLKRRPMFGSRKNDETRACAAYALGMSGVVEALPVLEKTSKSKNVYLKSQSLDAIKKIKAALS